MSSVSLFGLALLAFVYSSNFAECYYTSQPTNLTVRNNLDYVNVIPAARERHKSRLFFVPFAVPLNVSTDNNTSPCEKDDGDDFPAFLSEKQVLHGGIVLVVLIGAYGFTLLAVVCNSYFLPCVETMCEKMNLTPDVAAATFMSIATSTPEFFTNIIGTFITESDLGIGTIVGSSLFNALGVPAIGGLNSPFPLQLDWYPLTRDCLIYAVSVTVLIVITWDGLIFWFETLIPLAVYIIYFVIMFNNKRIAKYVKSKVNKNKVEITPEGAPDSVRVVHGGITTISEEYTENFANGDFAKKVSHVDEVPKRSLLARVSERISKVEVDCKNLQKVSINSIPKQSIMSAYGSYLEEANKPEYTSERQKVLEVLQLEETQEAKKSLFRRPTGTWFKQFVFYYIWPIKIILKCTVPSPKTHPNLYPVTFMMCIVWIGINSYVVSWMISIIGVITKLPDALLGMTLMAVGGCLPETVSMTIIARRGEGAFGVSNSLGANTMNVLYSLGLPWLFKNIMQGLSNDYPVRIQSGSIEYTILSLIFAVGTLYVTMVICKFKLSKISGCVLGGIYICLVTLAVVSQTVLFKPEC